MIMELNHTCGTHYIKGSLLPVLLVLCFIYLLLNLLLLSKRQNGYQKVNNLMSGGAMHKQKLAMGQMLQDL